MTSLVLLPGMMCDARLFGPQIAALSGTATIHLAPITARDSVQALARDVLADAPPRFALAGLSMGGIVAMEVLRQAPERVAKIALMDTNPLAERAEVKARRLPQIKAAAEGRLRSVLRDEMKPSYLADCANRETILDLCMDMALALGPDVFARQSRALMDRPDQCDTLRAARLPALVLCGRDDALCPVERHEHMASLIPDARLHIVEGAGHLPTLEQPEVTSRALRLWLHG
ncbi:alpha/beta fold hydrolase [Antarctobacter sp.]|uniref:alpha/beta fold hydrolase n=1 Tax=Antarctobacter sp. TaxID=1872577 RepID=UPI003A8DCE20